LKPRLLQDWIAAQADTRPSATAIVAAGTRLSYGELEQESNRLARLLRAAGCRPGERVALLAPISPIAIVGQLGIYKAAATYVPLDPENPVSRLNTMIDSCGSRWLITAGVPVSLLDRLLETRAGGRELVIASLDRRPLHRGRHQAIFNIDDLAAYSAEPVDSVNGPDDPANILFTSGAAGTPKGVVITHANVIPFIEWATAYFGMVATDRVSAHSPLHFHLSSFDLFGAAAVGAEIHLVPPELATQPERLAQFIRASQLTQWFSVPSVLDRMAKADAVALNDFPSLKRVIWGGEVLPTPALIYWMQRLPHASFTNLYGPTETTIASSYYTVPECPVDPRAAIPIGTACTGEELLVLDDHLMAPPAGGTGDLYIAGAGLARGYWADPERTAAAFPHHPHRPSEWIYKTGDLARVGDDGQIYFLGRADEDVSIGGSRIETGAIEAAVNAVPDVIGNAVMTLAHAGPGAATICCAYVPAAGCHATPAVLSAALGRLIPDWLIPTRWLCLDGFPINANGKVDRHRLKEAFATRTDPHAAHTS
jgi:amino acid adenylation domain-containing protein